MSTTNALIMSSYFGITFSRLQISLLTTLNVAHDSDSTRFSHVWWKKYVKFQFRAHIHAESCQLSNWGRTGLIDLLLKTCHEMLCNLILKFVYLKKKWKLCPLVCWTLRLLCNLWLGIWNLKFTTYLKNSRHKNRVQQRKKRKHQGTQLVTSDQ